MADTLNYITIYGETWSGISWKMYGSMSGIQKLIEANPLVPADPVLPTGTILYVPIVNSDDDIVVTTNMPPWK